MSDKVIDTYLRLKNFAEIPTDAVGLCREFGVARGVKILRSRFKRWHAEVWKADLNDYLCCSGFDSSGQVGCGCFGMTTREYLSQ